jgi:glycosyltransferase involved in cell wall biosynthesis
MTPTVSIIVPCYNEEKRIRSLLDAIFAQTYPREKMDVTISDGFSTDRTREVIQEFQREHSSLAIKIVNNLRRNIPSALNAAIAASAGEVIVRIDAHSAPYPDYVERCVAALEQGKGENVGGIWEIHPNGEGWIAKSIAVAAAHPLGAGDALYRHATQPAYVETVPFGAYRRSLLETVGLYDESLITNEDYEFNARILRAGGRIWLDPAIRCVYFARPTLLALASQYWRYGFWKREMLRRYPATLRWRQALPPLFALSVLVLILVSPAWPFFGLLLSLELFTYFGILTFAAVSRAFRSGALYLVPGMPLAIAVMHFAWGGGFLWGTLRGAK